MNLIMRGLAAVLLVAGSATVHAQQADHHGMDHGSHADGAKADALAVEAYREADKTMHRAMEREYTGDPDKDFVSGMIPHHEGAIAMARVVLKYGKDPEIRKLAEEIVAAQEREIAELTAIGERLKKP